MSRVACMLGVPVVTVSGGGMLHRRSAVSFLGCAWRGLALRYTRGLEGSRLPSLPWTRVFSCSGKMWSGGGEWKGKHPQFTVTLCLGLSGLGQGACRRVDILRGQGLWNP